MKCCTVTVGSSVAAARPPAIYTNADYATRLQPFMPGARAGGQLCQAPGQRLSLQPELGYESVLGFPFQSGGAVGRQPGYKVTRHSAAHTTAYLNISVQAPERPRRGPAAPRARPATDRKELINPALMTPSSSSSLARRKCPGSAGH